MIVRQFSNGIRVEYPNREVRRRNVQSTARPVDWKRPNEYPATKDLKSVVNYQLMANNRLKKEVEQQVIDNYKYTNLLWAMILGVSVVLIILLWIGAEFIAKHQSLFVKP